MLMKQFAGWYTFALYSDGSVGPGVRAMGQTDGNATSPVPLPVNEWSHLAATYDGTTLRLYVNGLVAMSARLHRQPGDVNGPAAHRRQQCLRRVLHGRDRRGPDLLTHAERRGDSRRHDAAHPLTAGHSAVVVERV